MRADDTPPADVDPAEFAPEASPTVIEIMPEGMDGVPHELMPEPNTDPHALARSAEFAAGVEVGRAQGERDGYARGLAAGRAEAHLGAGVDYALDGFRRAMIVSGTDPTVAFLEMSKLRDWLLVNPPK